MTKFNMESGLVFNLGGYVVERLVKPDFIDVVIGNPHKEDIKINLPILSREMLQELHDEGLIIEYMHENDSLKDTLEKAREKVNTALGKTEV